MKIQTDATKRYENEITPELCGEAMDILTQLIVEIAGTKDTKVGEVVDKYPNKAKKIELGISAKEASDILGVKITEAEIGNIFDRFGFVWKKSDDEKIVVTIPDERLDLRIKEDLAEEIGRIYGYEKIPDIEIQKPKVLPTVDKSFAYKEKIRRILYNEGFSEVMNYTFVEKGEIELANPMSPEKKFLRTNLVDSLDTSLIFNTWHAELVDMPQIRIFEFGHIFSKKGESEHFVFGIQTPGVKKPADKKDCESVMNILSGKLGIELKKINTEENIAEFDLLQILEKIPELKEYDFSEVGDKNVRFKKISPYPYMIRDIAVFTPEGTKAEAVFSIIQNEAGGLMIKNRLFDVFTKKFPDGSSKTSYAYRLIFQSYERTLSDDEVNAIMEKITKKMNANAGWQVR